MSPPDRQTTTKRDDDDDDDDSSHPPTHPTVGLLAACWHLMMNSVSHEYIIIVIVIIMCFVSVCVCAVCIYLRVVCSESRLGTAAAVVGGRWSWWWWPPPNKRAPSNPLICANTQRQGSSSIVRRPRVMSSGEMVMWPRPQNTSSTAMLMMRQPILVTVPVNSWSESPERTHTKSPSSMLTQSVPLLPPLPLSPDNEREAAAFFC
jgi:hypothetical protein